MTKKLESIGKFLCYVLRHKPEEVIGFSVDSNGWGRVAAMVSGTLTFKDIIDAALFDTKGRFELKNTMDGTMVRCLYGHSIPHVKIEQEGQIDRPEFLYHGTTKAAALKIRTEGLKPMSRNEVCLTSNQIIAYQNGMRYAKDVKNLVILGVLLDDTILADEQVQLRQVGDIWCAQSVPVKYLFPISIEHFKGK